ncbi:MAG: hypothetical protein GX236_02305 [Clostridiaceae bacterium]|nr:hypothetical protein [Clostridiaceae bacterium]
MRVLDVGTGPGLISIDIIEYYGQIINVKDLIMTVIQKGRILNISLCDGSCDFSEDHKVYMGGNI